MTPPVHPVATNLHLVPAGTVAATAAPDQAQTPPRQLRPLGQFLLEAGAVSPSDLVDALALQARHNAPLGRVLLANAMAEEDALLAALSRQTSAEIVDPDRHPPDPRLIDVFGAARCLRSRVLPWRRAGEFTVVAVSSIEDFEHMRAELQAAFGPVVMALASEAALQAAILSRRRRDLARRCETRTAEDESCRRWPAAAVRRGALAVLTASLILGYAAPALLIGVLVAWAGVALLACTALKAAALISHLRREKVAETPLETGIATIARLPTVSILVPLFDEKDIAARLVTRLSRLDYPRELLDVILVVEEDDMTTRVALAKSHLPPWMRIVIAPHAPLRTKPRALNFALDFARGTIVGVYDAEDAPEPDQIHRVVARFHERGSELACVQGVLDYYNPRTNWLSRCFTIEYASWFRIVLPGLERLDLPVPLGGTTLFFRRHVLEELGGWDAHNVTEDADLGIRLARHGYRTELLDTVTEEEANCRPLAWVRQRSRWLKGYAMTYAVHMRDPALLLRQLGWWRFTGVQVLFAGTLTQYLLAPVMWSFWLVILGFWHPLVGVMPTAAFWILGGLFALSEALNWVIGWCAVADRRHRFLRPWVPTLHFYFPLGALAAYKGAWELLTNPYYWDKTAHGLFDRTEPKQ